MDRTLFCALSLFYAELTFEPNSTYLFTGESANFTCDMREGNDNDWHYKFNRNGQQIVSFNTNNWYSFDLTTDSSGDYQCIGRHKGSTNFEKESNNVTLSVSAHRPKATLRADRTGEPVGATVTLTCSEEGSAGWKYEWFRRTSDSDETMIITDGSRTENFISVSQGGIYRCRGRRGNTVFFTEFSDVSRVDITLSNRASVTRQQNWTHIISGEAITVICEIEGGGDTKWEYEWRTTGSNTPPAHREYRISSASVSDQSYWWCKGRRDLYSSTEWSDSFPLIVSPYKPRPTVVADKRTIPVDSNETLICSMENSAEWKYYWFRRNSVFSESQIIRHDEQDNMISISQGGIYHCRGGRGSPVFFTEDSDPVTIEKRVSNKAVISLQPNWPLLFSGETITVRCDIHGGGESEWDYEWSRTNSDTIPTHNEFRISSATESNSGNYRCMGKHKWDMYSSTEWSDIITLAVSSHRPMANLSADNRAFPVGGSVTLTCSMNPSSSGWKYFWYKGEKTSEPLAMEDAVANGEIRVSQEGLYWCRGQRGSPAYYTEYSDSINVNKIVTNKAVVILKHNWPEVYSGETITLRCEIQGGDTDWDYEWTTTSSYTPPNQKEYLISPASSLYDGDYWCKGRQKRAQQNSTGWSISFKLTVSYYQPVPVLTVSPSWLSPGDSVTLNCEVEPPSAGWRFYWYKAVPKISDMDIPHDTLDLMDYDDILSFDRYKAVPEISDMDIYNYELLPGSSKGTEQDSYIVHGQTHTAGYMCRAGRGDPVYYTDYTGPKFVLSGDFPSQVSLTVSPDRAQHFTSDSVSLNCEGNSTEWRVRRYTEDRYSWYTSPYCSFWGSMIGSTCHMHHHRLRDAVFWCESSSGEFSNAVNITTDDDIILVSPVHPVTEGDSVTLGCKLTTEQLLSNVTFYKNNKHIQNGNRTELKISAVSKSDEGFYHCAYSESESPQSWMSVKSTSSPFTVRLIVGLVIGILLILLLPLLLLCWYKKSKDTCCHRLIQSRRTNQSSATVQTVNQDENQQQVYSSLLHGDVCVYETIIGSGNTGRGERTDNYRNAVSQIQLKHFVKRGMHDDPAETSDYSNVNASAGS
ncbi:uncharacterized protein LOC127363446 isoform X2 [Dicentrarchus labrax]|uniref:uncharacterized protein LOC127363446 isoform X2 n=1 Tax=Dicentrarchus labrax TaxID=13489 RepID=UPI0021F568D9|nr:uncharacterized protein LOC127363446 isoform X2 [Dicentrarchus labrax]